jgi:RNA polymerase sigma-70 factor (ECF subfamily)
MKSDPGHLQDETSRHTIFVAWLETHYQAIVRYCVARLGTLQGEDVAQDVFVAAWEGLPTFVPRPELPPEAWLVGIARNKCLDAARTRRRRRALAQQFLADITHAAHTPSPISAEDTVTLERQAQQQDRRLTASLARLAPEERLCIIWRYIKGLSFEDLGDLLGLSPSAAQRRCNRAVHRLRERMYDDTAV